MQRLVVGADQFNNNSNVYLSSEQRHYLLSVLRLQPGDRLIVLDGNGKGWLAELNESETLDLLEKYKFTTELPIAITLAAALPKNGFDEVVRCCTELGVNNIIPLISARTILKPSANKLKRWQKIVTEAAEQSERAIVPKVLDPLPWKKYIQSLTEQNSETNYFCAARAKSNHLIQSINKVNPSALTLHIGPEGGWTDQEIEEAIAHDMEVVSLGSSILRAVTASITALSIVNAQIQSKQSNV